ncbi:MAG: exopolyphosphatase, partial [Pseudomonadota bacterium]
THEIGLNISSSGLQKHSAYILENSTLPGFSVEQQLLVTSIVRFHRKRLRPEQFPEMAIVTIEELLALILLLRLSVVWHVNRHPEGPSLPGIQVVEGGYLLQLPEQFPEQYPLLTADLEREAEHLAQAGIELLISLS